MKKKLTSLKSKLTAALFAAAAMPLYADGEVEQMQSVLDKIQEIIQGPVVRSILVIALIACAIAYGMNKDNEKVKQGALAIGIATGIILGATQLMQLIWPD